MREGKAFGSSGIVMEMGKAGCDAMLDVVTYMINLTIKKEQIPDERHLSRIIICFKGKGDTTTYG